MPWTEITRRNYAREGLRYATDSTDEEWAVVACRASTTLSARDNHHGRF